MASSVTVSPPSSCTSRLSTREQQVLDAVDGKLEARHEPAEHEPADAAIAARRPGTRRRCSRRWPEATESSKSSVSGSRSPRSRSASASAASRVSCSANTRSSRVISKIRRMWGSEQTTLTVPPDGRSCLSAPSSTPSVIESMKVASLRSITSARGASVDRLRDRRAQLGRGVQVGLAEHGHDGDVAAVSDHLDPERRLLDDRSRRRPAHARRPSQGASCTRSSSSAKRLRSAQRLRLPSTARSSSALFMRERPGMFMPLASS